MNPVVKDVPAQVEQAQIVHAPIDLACGSFAGGSCYSASARGNQTLSPKTALSSEQSNRRIMQNFWLELRLVLEFFGVVVYDCDYGKARNTAMYPERSEGNNTQQNISPALRADVAAKSAASVGPPASTNARGGATPGAAWPGALQQPKRNIRRCQQPAPRRTPSKHPRWRKSHRKLCSRALIRHGWRLLSKRSSEFRMRRNSIRP